MRTWQRSHPGWVSFVEVLLCFLVVIMPIVSMLKNKGVETKAEYVITAEWSILDTDPDVDLWAMPPGGLPVFYRNRQVGLTFLDQDCLGKSNSTAVQADGTTVALNVCKETITLRGIVAGRYDLALNLYSYRDGAHTVVEKSDSLDVKVHVEIIAVNPQYKTLYQKDLVLTRTHQTINWASFTLDNLNAFTMVAPPVDPITADFLVKG